MKNQAIVSFSPNLNYTYVKDSGAVGRIKEELARHELIEFDTETTGLDYLADNILMYQFGLPERQYVVDARYIPIAAFADILSSEQIKKVGHNLKFDYLFAKNNGVTMEGLIDTMLAEHCLTAGLQKFGRDLETCASKYLRYKLDKNMQQSFVGHYGDFSDRQIRYAAMDVAIPRALIMAQYRRLQALGLVPTFKLECDVLPSFADMEYFGLELDVDAWLANHKGAGEKLVQIVSDLNGELGRLIKESNPEDWSGLDDSCFPDITGQVYFNWNSQPQLLGLLQTMYPQISSTGDAVLEKLADEYGHPLVSLLREYRSYAKQTGTYGTSYVAHIHPRDGRFHPIINQYGTDTGRPSGKKPNMLNIPREKSYRTPWRGGAGRKIITKDYSGCELRIVASMSGDPGMIEAFSRGLCLHTYVAAKFKNMDYDELDKKRKAGDDEAVAVRTAVKSLNFGRR